MAQSGLDGGCVHQPEVLKSELYEFVGQWVTANGDGVHVFCVRTVCTDNLVIKIQSIAENH